MTSLTYEIQRDVDDFKPVEFNSKYEDACEWVEEYDPDLITEWLDLNDNWSQFFTTKRAYVHFFENAYGELIEFVLNEKREYLNDYFRNQWEECERMNHCENGFYERGFDDE